MKQLIQSIDGWAELTAAEIRTVLVTPDPQRRSVAEATYNSKQLLAAILPRTVETLISTLRGAGFVVSANAIESKEGLDFGHPNMQGQIDELGEGMPDVFTPEIVAELKALGVDSRSPWQRFSGAADPTEAEVDASKGMLLADQYTSAVYEAIAAARDVDGYTAETIKAAADAVGV